MTDQDIHIIEKRKTLRNIHKVCLNHSKYYKARYKRLKTKDDIIDVITTILNMSALSMTVSGFAMPLFLIGSACCAGIGLVISQAQKTYNFKLRYTNANVCVNQYEEIAREITAVLLRNHMSSQDYSDYIDDVNAKLSMIDDSRSL